MEPALKCTLYKILSEKVDLSFVGGYKLQVASRLEMGVHVGFPPLVLELLLHLVQVCAFLLFLSPP